MKNESNLLGGVLIGALLGVGIGYLLGVDAEKRKQWLKYLSEKMLQAKQCACGPNCDCGEDCDCGEECDCNEKEQDAATPQTT